ncbi:MAG: type VII toxin-antitoxin system MntA family adenylyltransferase antitoxin [Polaromonas sp.]
MQPDHPASVMRVSVNTLTQLFASQPAVVVALLFGSVARGTHTPESDLDVAVLTRQPMSMTDKRGLIEQMAVTMGRAVDLIDLATVGQPLLGQILKDAKRLKGTDSQFAQLLLKNAEEQEDFMPYITRLLQTRRAAWTG